MEKQNQIFRPKTGIPVFRRILSVLIRFLLTGTGFLNHQFGSYQPETGIFKSHTVPYQPEPEFLLSTGIPVLNPVPVVPYSHPLPSKQVSSYFPECVATLQYIACGKLNGNLNICSISRLSSWYFSALIIFSQLTN